MPRYAIMQERALTTQYVEAADTIDAVNAARAALIDHAKHGELHVAKIPDVPYDEGDSRSEARYEENNDDRAAERRRAQRMLGGAVSDSETTEPIQWL